MAMRTLPILEAIEIDEMYLSRLGIISLSGLEKATIGKLVIAGVFKGTSFDISALFENPRIHEVIFDPERDADPVVLTSPQELWGEGMKYGYNGTYRMKYNPLMGV
jgi:hypothetical protein